MPDFQRTIEPTRVILAKENQRVLFTQRDGSYHLTTEVKAGGRWQPFWYEDEATPLSRELKSAGLFYPHGAAHVATPWETVEAHLAIAGALCHDPKHPLTELLLRLSNLNRVNAFDFFPACWSERVRAHDPRPRPASELHFPIEPFYSLEGTGGHRGPTAAYMASLSLWNHWLYDALAVADDPAVLVLNLASFDGYEEALTGVERQFIVYNAFPAGQRSECSCLRLPAPPRGCQERRSSEYTGLYGSPSGLSRGSVCRSSHPDAPTPMREPGG